MKLNVPLIRQEKDTKDCGLAGLVMIFAYNGIHTSIEKLRKEIKVDETGTYAPQLGSYMISKGLEVELVTLHPSLLTLKDINRNSRYLIKRFEKLKEKSKSEQNKMVLGYFIDFLRDGGRIKVKIPNENDVRQEIEQGRPVGALLTSNFLNSSTPRFNFHFNLITGIDSKNIYVNDPWPGKRGGKQKYKLGDFFFGIYSSMYGDLDNGCLIKVINSKRK